MSTKTIGRPSKFDTINKEKFKILAIKGFTDNELCDFFDINRATLYRWKNSNKEFCDSLKNWKNEADAKVEKSLYQRAIGYEYDEITYEKSKTGGLGIKLTEGEVTAIKHENTYKVKITTKQVVPDVIAEIFWLKNRKPEEWRDKHEVQGNINFSAKLIMATVQEASKLNRISGHV